MHLCELYTPRDKPKGSSFQLRSLTVFPLSPSVSPFLPQVLALALALREKPWHWRAMYDDRLRLIEKRVVGFLLVLIELFSLGVTAEALRVNIGSKSAISFQRGPVDLKFQVEGVPPPTILFLIKLG